MKGLVDGGEKVFGKIGNEGGYCGEILRDLEGREATEEIAVEVGGSVRGKLLATGKCGKARNQMGVVRDLTGQHHIGCLMTSC